MNETNDKQLQLSPEDESLAEQIRELLADGHSGKDIIQMGYKESTVRQEARKWAKKNGKAINNERPMLPVKLGKGDTIPVEAEISNIVIDGDAKYRAGFLDGMRTLVAGAKLSQMLTGNLAEITSSQLAILKEAKSDSEDVAERTVVAALPYFEKMITESARASSPNPMASMFSRLLENPMSQALNGMFKMFGMPQAGGQGQGQGQNLPPGWENLTEQK